MTARRIATWVVVLGILAAAAWVAWWFLFSPAAKIRQEYGLLVRRQEEYRPFPTARELHDMLHRNDPLASPPPPASAPQLYDPGVMGASERLGKELRAFDGTSGLELLRDCFRSNAGQAGGDKKREEANRLVAQRIGVQYCLGLPADRLRPALEFVKQSDWGDPTVPELLRIFLERLLRDGPAEFQALDAEAHQKKQAGDYPGALDVYRKSLAYAEKWQLPVPEARTLIGMGSTLRKMGQLQEAEKAYLKAKAVLDVTPHPGCRRRHAREQPGPPVHGPQPIRGRVHLDVKGSRDRPEAVIGRAGLPGARPDQPHRRLRQAGQTRGRRPLWGTKRSPSAARTARGPPVLRRRQGGRCRDQGRPGPADGSGGPVPERHRHLRAVGPEARRGPGPTCANYAHLLDQMGRTAAARDARDKAAAYRQAAPPAVPTP